VLRKRDGCDAKPTKGRSSKERKSKETAAQHAANRRPGGYLIGRHPECGKCYLCNVPMVLLI
jgi:serine/threonine-protein kinase Chk2